MPNAAVGIIGEGVVRRFHETYNNQVSARFEPLTLAAQTGYAELAERTLAFELRNALGGLTGSFSVAERKGSRYWYFSYREPGIERPRLVYVGPDTGEVRELVERFRSERLARPLIPQARAAIAQGCSPLAAKHFRVIKRLAEYGLFRSGGVLVGTHAFVALGNLLGAKWTHGERTLDIDVAHAGRNVSVALPSDLKIDAHGALQSLKMGLLPIVELDGRLGAQYRSPDAELRIDFLTSMTRSRKPVTMPNLNVALEPLKFMEFLLEGTTQGCVFANSGACTVNLPDPARFAVHKLIIHGERPARERAKARKDTLQVAALASWFVEEGETKAFNRAWRDALSRGPGWKKRALEGKAAVLAEEPKLDIAALWKVLRG